MSNTDGGGPQGSPTRLHEGQDGGAHGVTFRYHANLADLVASTSAPPGFAWRWLYMGTVAAKGANGPQGVDAVIVLGRDGATVHGLVSPNDAPFADYFTADVGSVLVEGVGSAGLVKKRPRAVKLTAGGLHAISIGVEEIMPSGNVTQRNQEAAFLAALGPG